MIRYDVICTVVFAANVNRRLICLLGPARCHGSPRCVYVGYIRYLFVDIVPRALADLGITSITMSWSSCVCSQLVLFDACCLLFASLRSLLLLHNLDMVSQIFVSGLAMFE